MCCLYNASKSLLYLLGKIIPSSWSGICICYAFLIFLNVCVYVGMRVHMCHWINIYVSKIVGAWSWHRVSFLICSTSYIEARIFSQPWPHCFVSQPSLLASGIPCFCFLCVGVVRPHSDIPCFLLLKATQVLCLYNFNPLLSSLQLLSVSPQSSQIPVIYLTFKTQVL